MRVSLSENLGYSLIWLHTRCVCTCFKFTSLVAQPNNRLIKILVHSAFDK